VAGRPDFTKTGKSEEGRQDRRKKEVLTSLESENRHSLKGEETEGGQREEKGV